MEDLYQTMGGCVLVLVVSLVLIVSLGLVWLAIWLSLRLRGLRRSVAVLEERLDRLAARVVVLDRRIFRFEGGGAAPGPPAGEARREPPPEPVPPVPAAAPGPAVPSAPAAPVTAAGPAPPASPVPSRAAAAVRPKRRLEEQLGARLPVWIGSIALALAGAYLVKYSVDQGWLGPAVRLTLAILFGIGLLALGEGLRRLRGTIPQGLSAAGVAVLFASFLAGVHLYRLIAPGVGFGLMALTAAVAVALSLRQGVMVALVGLVGGFFTPLWIRVGEPDPWKLFAYLLLLQIGLFAVSRRRSWGWIALLTLGASLVWVVAWLLGPGVEGAAVVPLGLFLAISAGLGVATGWGRRTGAPTAGWGMGVGWLVGAAPLGGLVVMSLVAGQAGFGTVEWTFVGLLAAAVLLLGRLEASLAPLPWVAVAVVGTLLAVWAVRLEPVEAGRFFATVSALGALLGLGAYAALWGSPRPGRWASLAALAGVGALLVAYGGGRRLAAALPWGVLALSVAGAYLVLALPLARRRSASAGHEAALAAMAVATTVLISLAVPLELERQWLGVAWAVEVPALVWLDGRFRLPALSRLAAALAALVAVRLLANPSLLSYPLGEGRIVNWILYGYGIPFVAFAAAAWQLRRDGRPESLHGLRPGLEWGAFAVGFALVTLEIHQLFSPGRLAAPISGLAEWGTYTAAWLVLGVGLVAVVRRTFRDPGTPACLAPGGRLLILFGLAAVVVGPGLVANPVWNHVWVGATAVGNLLLWAYGVPAVLLAAAAWQLDRAGSPHLARVAASFSLMLTFALVTLEVRQLFRGGYLDGGPAAAGERYAYSAAWVVLGTILLVTGILRRGVVLRYASLAVMSLAVLKVFLFDTAQLTGLLRVLSFLGLGASLLLLAFLYQRFVFRRESG